MQLSRAQHLAPGLVELLDQADPGIGAARVGGEERVVEPQQAAHLLEAGAGLRRQAGARVDDDPVALAWLRQLNGDDVDGVAGLIADDPAAVSRGRDALHRSELLEAGERQHCGLLDLRGHPAAQRTLNVEAIGWRQLIQGQDALEQLSEVDHFLLHGVVRDSVPGGLRPGPV